ncbi:hypothetical protein [Francisella philomiragia]|uniref:hypothetical protein n=1 Tax=Francisella philomiragia TaxID=28110 RepID=UPI001903B1AE|nr:hypothetical protein [Francisella philomiragia]MBK2093722.1 hypothetical protein [Francisella philomiragia]MBK2256209.1 hypothetical protein [Francisella philomiragia]MBK2268867.1 hypothetical protein [Francisella philomiragia]MBK2270658.1 hypothetical protein [Francisella philomiragia]MBK2274438.1 hypothetical protein [Francisella philomiragia]
MFTKTLIVTIGIFLNISLLNAAVLYINKIAGNIPNNLVAGVGSNKSTTNQNSSLDYLYDTPTFRNITSMPWFSRCGETTTVCKKYSNGVYVEIGNDVFHIVSGNGEVWEDTYLDRNIFGISIDSLGRLKTYSGILGNPAPYAHNAGDIIDRYTNTDFSPYDPPNFNVIDEFEKSIAAFLETQDSEDSDIINKPCGSSWFCSKETVREQINNYCSENKANKYCQTKSSSN